MKRLVILLHLCGCACAAYSQGTSCSNAIPLTLNGVINNYPTSGTTDVYAICSSFTGSSPVTWFNFTTDATGSCPLLNISASDKARCEIAFYSSCSGNMNNNLLTTSSMCFDRGQGLWAPAETYVLKPSTKYYLRVKTTSACTLSVGGQYYTPPNTTCNGAFSIGTTTRKDNNACHRPGQGVTPDQLCAFTLENTAFYEFYVASTGAAIINISDIACDNGDGNNSSGFQIGFFQGTCNGLIPISCNSGSGTFVQGTTPSLPAGAHVYVAIDGMAGSNCQYSIAGVNVYGVLATNFSNFSGWKTNSSNILKWTCTQDTSALYEVERSANGADFVKIGQVSRPLSSSGEVAYSFEDSHPLHTGWYRVKQLDKGGKIAMSRTLMIVRDDIQLLKVEMVNPVRSTINFSIETDITGMVQYTISSITGQELYTGTLYCTGGTTRLVKVCSTMPTGKYIVIINSKEQRASKVFMKL